jgi:hypothetical protein
LDLFTGSGPTRKQIHELHGLFHGGVGTAQPNPVADDKDPAFGPFWSVPVPEASLRGNPYTAVMTLDFVDAPQHEAFATGATPEVMGAKATVHVDWMPGAAGLFTGLETGASYIFRSPAAGFAGEYTLSGAHIDFSFTSQVSATDTTPFTFTSNPDGQRVLFAQVGHELNGLFMR